MITQMRAPTIDASLIIKGVASETKLDVTYRNLRKSEYEALADECIKKAEGTKDAMTAFNVAMVQALVESWSIGDINDAQAVEEAEWDHRGLLVGVLRGFHQAHEVNVAKN